jgi:hypothetical protein
MFMRKKLLPVLIAFLCIVLSVSPSAAEIAKMDEAKNVAQNWISLIINLEGDWGGLKTAEVTAVDEFKRSNRVLGYVCHVSPGGFILISLHKELAPVKAFSYSGHLNPASDRGLCDLLKGDMEHTLDIIEQKTGSLDAVRSSDVRTLLKMDYTRAWEKLSGPAIKTQSQSEEGASEMSYQAGQELLRTSWHQDTPYNSQCPSGNTGCTDCCPSAPNPCPPSAPTVVGCVATAGAQVMKYWNWPPYGVGSHTYTWSGDDSCGTNSGGGALSATFSDSYAWNFMANGYHWDFFQNRWQDEDNNPLAQQNLDAVSELSYEVGVAVEMDFGVCGSNAVPWNPAGRSLDDALVDNFRYSAAVEVKYRQLYLNAVDWFNEMKGQINQNRPIVYTVPGHAIVADGWFEIFFGAELFRYYHMNYGWAGAVPSTDPNWTDYTTSNCFFQLDNLPGSFAAAELMLINIYPVQSLGNYLSGTYPRESFNYRYFNVDATAADAAFAPGQNLQFLQNVTVTCPSRSGTSIRFNGSNSLPTRLFSRGDLTKGIRINNGSIKLMNGGSIAFR